MCTQVDTDFKNTRFQLIDLFSPFASHQTKTQRMPWKNWLARAQAVHMCRIKYFLKIWLFLLYRYDCVGCIIVAGFR